MSQSVISDNWSLQSVSELLLNGIDSDFGHVVVPNTETDSHGYEEVPSSVIALEALFDLITDVILRDQILVDEKFTNSWFRKGGPLNGLAENSIVRPFDFTGSPEKLSGPREEFVDRLCMTSSLRQEHLDNIRGWETERKAQNPFLSQVIWGGAGMLARAFVFEKGYTPHPVRKRLFQRAGIALSDTDASLRACSIISEKRASIRSPEFDS